MLLEQLDTLAKEKVHALFSQSYNYPRRILQHHVYVSHIVVAHLFVLPACMNIDSNNNILESQEYYAMNVLPFFFSPFPRFLALLFDC